MGVATIWAWRPYGRGHHMGVATVMAGACRDGMARYLWALCVTLLELRNQLVFILKRTGHSIRSAISAFTPEVEFLHVGDSTTKFQNSKTEEYVLKNTPYFYNRKDIRSALGLPIVGTHHVCVNQRAFLWLWLWHTERLLLPWQPWQPEHVCVRSSAKLRWR